MGNFYNRFSSKYKKRVKICIDTCHIFSTGNDICNHHKTIISNINKYIGWENIIIIHLNDSSTVLNSRVDRHQNLNKGFITEKGKKSTGLEEFTKYCYNKNLPIILETPNKTANSRKNDIQIMKEWCNI